MLVEGYTRDGEQCAWTLDDMDKMRDDFTSVKANREKFNTYYKKNLLIIIAMWKHDSNVLGKPCKVYDGGTGSEKEMIANQALVCFLLNLHHSPLWKKIVETIDSMEKE